MRRFLFLFVSDLSALSTVTPDFVDNPIPYFLYILKSEVADRYYVGVSSNPQRRLEYHNGFEKGFTSRYRPWAIVFTRKYPSKAQALVAETTVKAWKSRKMIERLIAGEAVLL